MTVIPSGVHRNEVEMNGVEESLGKCFQLNYTISFDFVFPPSSEKRAQDDIPQQILGFH
ncbi:MAG TPA: hypothetical protein VFX22_11955 [Candidatus Kapabacteria bacterium]|nr:hypothetical protein [Candidatus Kapabacteria bacterium]